MVWIYFKDNPWEEGHRIKRFIWQARVVKGDVWFDMELVTEDVSEKRVIDEDEVLPTSDWGSAGVWANYHCCTLSTLKWHEGGFNVCKLKDYSPEHLDGLTLSIDDSPDDLAEEAYDELSFLAYILGHDSVAKHNITFERIGNTDRFNIIWHGKVALTYMGAPEFKYDFSTTLNDVLIPRI